MSQRAIPKKTGSVIWIVVIGLILSAPLQAWAQADTTSYGNEVSLHVGSLLPNQIDGVTEILPVFGGRYGIATGIGVIELGASNSHAMGVDFTTFTTSLRGEVPLADLIHGIVYGGLDLNYYRPIDQGAWQTATGIHFGTGVMMHATGTLWLRSDLKFMGGPGTSLYLGFGIVLRGTGGGGGGGAN